MISLNFLRAEYESQAFTGMVVVLTVLEESPQSTISTYTWTYLLALPSAMCAVVRVSRTVLEAWPARGGPNRSLTRQHRHITTITTRARLREFARFSDRDAVDIQRKIANL
jgi:hypothetical protein